jgi:ferric-dicitrate binding protein FerR (iron transport regulator)
VTDPDRRAQVLAAHARLEEELRGERRQWIRASAWAAVLTVAFAAWWLGGYILSKPEFREGTASTTRQVSDDGDHEVIQIIELDDGRSVTVRPLQVAPIGSRVTVSERKTWWGRHTYSIVYPAK